MEGVISAYKLKSDIGKRISNIKFMPEAWSLPVFMKEMVKNPGPLLVYDKLYIDEPAYVSLYNSLTHSYRRFIRNLVESKQLNLFHLYKADDLLLGTDVQIVKDGASKLFFDESFQQIIRDLVKR